MKKFFSVVASGAGAALALGFSAGAFAQSTWNFGGACDPFTCSAGGVSATVSGFGSSGANYVAGTVTDQDPSGLGFTSSGETSVSPDHAFDNRGGSGLGTTNEVMLINFGAAKVQLTAMAIGWFSGDADVSVLRWDGASAPTMTSIAGPGGLAGAGWTLVSSKDVDASSSNFVLNTGVGTNKNDAKVSSWWLISTYFGATDSTNGLDTANDYFKILSFTGKICTGTVTGGTCSDTGGGVPEPGTVALAAVGALAAFGARRRAKKAVA